MLGCDLAATALDRLAERVTQLERAVEKIGGVPVPQIWEPIVDGPHFIPRERVQNRTPEQIVGVPVPQILEDGLHLVSQEHVLNRTREQLVDVPVPQIMEAAVENRVGEQIVDSPVLQFIKEDIEIMFSAPQDNVQNPNVEVYAGRVRAPPQERVQNRFSKPVMDVPLPQIKQGAVSTGKVFTVKLRHHRYDHACSDYVGFIKGLDKHNMPRSGDVMVPALQIQGHLVPRHGSTALSGAACVLGVLKRERSWEASLPPEMLRELQEARRKLYEQIVDGCVRFLDEVVDMPVIVHVVFFVLQTVE